MTSENLYVVAYLVSEGAELKRIAVSRSNGGRNTAVFEVDAPAVERLAAEYYAERAVVNLAAFRRHLEEVKDALFAALKSKTETERRAEHEAHRQGRARAAQASR